MLWNSAWLRKRGFFNVWNQLREHLCRMFPGLKVPLAPKCFFAWINFRFCPVYCSEKLFGPGFFIQKLYPFKVRKLGISLVHGRQYRRMGLVYFVTSSQDFMRSRKSTNSKRLQNWSIFQSLTVCAWIWTGEFDGGMKTVELIGNIFNFSGPSVQIIKISSMNLNRVWGWMEWKGKDWRKKGPFKFP